MEENPYKAPVHVGLPRNSAHQKRRRLEWACIIVVLIGWNLVIAVPGLMNAYVEARSVWIDGYPWAISRSITLPFYAALIALMAVTSPFVFLATRALLRFMEKIEARKRSA